MVKNKPSRDDLTPRSLGPGEADEQRHDIEGRHPTTRQRTYVDISSWPFQIPMGALIPIRVENLLAAAKNLSVTHITNGCYRLHPVEWNVGEAAGALAAYCLIKDLVPRQVRATPELLADFQRLITSTLGFVITWPNPRATAR